MSPIQERYRSKPLAEIGRIAAHRVRIFKKDFAENMEGLNEHWYFRYRFYGKDACTKI